MTAPWMLAAAQEILGAPDSRLASGLADTIARHYRLSQKSPDVPANTPHLEVRLAFLPLKTARRPWVQQPPTFDQRVWQHTGILFEKAPIESHATPPKGYGFGLLQAYRDGRAIPMGEFEGELTRLGITSESIEGLV